jgi:hypothetical protein
MGSYKKNSRSKSWSILNWVYKHTRNNKLVCTYTQYDLLKMGVTTRVCHYIYLHLNIYLYLYLSVYISIYSSIYLYLPNYLLRLSVSLFIHLYVYLSICPKHNKNKKSIYIYISALSLSICTNLSICFVYVYMYLFIYLSSIWMALAFNAPTAAYLSYVFNYTIRPSRVILLQ